REIGIAAVLDYPEENLCDVRLQSGSLPIGSRRLLFLLALPFFTLLRRHHGRIILGWVWRRWVWQLETADPVAQTAERGQGMVFDPVQQPRLHLRQIRRTFIPREAPVELGDDIETGIVTRRKVRRSFFGR